MYCNLIAIRREALTGAQKAKWETCEDPELGAFIESLLFSKEYVIREHLRARRGQYPKMAIFIYGHTHQLEELWAVALEEDDSVKVLNSGTFQRIIDESGFLERVNADPTLESPEKEFKKMPLEALAPCYTFIEVSYKDGKPEAKTRQWHMPENGQGQTVYPGHPMCN
jgi:hypothetical protein